MQVSGSGQRYPASQRLPHLCVKASPAIRTIPGVPIDLVVVSVVAVVVVAVVVVVVDGRVPRPAVAKSVRRQRALLMSVGGLSPGASNSNSALYAAALFCQRSTPGSRRRRCSARVPRRQPDQRSCVICASETTCSWTAENSWRRAIPTSPPAIPPLRAMASAAKARRTGKLARLAGRVAT